MRINPKSILSFCLVAAVNVPAPLNPFQNNRPSRLLPPPAGTLTIKQCSAYKPLNVNTAESGSAIFVNGKFVYGENADKPNDPASTIKMVLLATFGQWIQKNNIDIHSKIPKDRWDLFVEQQYAQNSQLPNDLKVNGATYADVIASIYHLSDNAAAEGAGKLFFTDYPIGYRELADKLNQFAANALPNDQKPPCFASVNGYPGYFPDHFSGLKNSENLSDRITQVTPKQMGIIFIESQKHYTHYMLNIFKSPTFKWSNGKILIGNNASKIHDGIVFKTGTTDYTSGYIKSDPNNHSTTVSLGPDGKNKQPELEATAREFTNAR